MNNSNKLYEDPVADRLLALHGAVIPEGNDTVKWLLLLSPLSLIVVFYYCVSSSVSSMISFSAFTFSAVFMGISLNMLVEILRKDMGPRGMQEIAEVIREGSEGFFITQYGSIFKYAFMTSLALFVMYAFREIPASSKLNEFFSPLGMAFITSISFVIGSVCSAIAGYAGIWVSVRANLRVAAASKRCYNDAI
jgi:Na+/H+-translocating membrane pyrophosphatase